MLLAVLGVSDALPGAQADKTKSVEDSNGWRKTADSFMSDLVAN